MLLLGLDPVCQLSSLTDQLVGLASFTESLGTLLAQVQDVHVQLFDLGLTGADGASIDQLLLGCG